MKKLKQDRAMELAMELLAQHGFVPVGETPEYVDDDGVMQVRFETKPSGQAACLHSSQDVKVDILPARRNGELTLFSIIVCFHHTNADDWDKPDGYFQTRHFTAVGSGPGHDGSAYTDFIIPTTQYEVIAYG